MSNSKLVTYTNITPRHKTSPRNHAIDTISIHCYVGQVTARQGCDHFATTGDEASTNYVVGKDGSIGLSVDEADRSWCTSSKSNDHRAVTIEVASDNKPPYAVTDAAYNALILLVADICQRNGIKQLVWSTNKADRVNHKNGCNMTVHRDYANKACPGEYLYSRHGDIAAKVNAILNPPVVAPPIVEVPKVETPKFITVAGFVDIPEGAWYIDAVKWAAEKGIATGKDATHFDPEGVCTRAQAVTFLWRASGSPAAGTDNPFTDVAESDYFYTPILWAVQRGITNGVDAAHFAPDSPCTRAQIVTMLWRAAGQPEPAGYQPFADIQPASWYAKAVQWAVDEGITNGKDSHHFAPDAPCTRAEMVTFLMRAYQ